ncbi:hypothetical protein J416_06203 [Gracilibacillus halophilus YIM-C55.5]|uniref:Tandem five-TM protein n=1 Tax=Gracilibacillus halophilus YIM-C55.5 TaxID=1308866 RepID=N4WX08_9BACI|nr:hypothetical protein [Gracilibacillus halophilus]ENH97581.1 hypothetical protein J416_06203 [Gracilibacillus halophilus YIM-C55.5]
MNDKIPIYGHKDKGRLGYTILYDKNTKKVYKVYHKEMKQTWYWAFFFATITILQIIQNIVIPIENSIYMFVLIIVGTFVSLLIGVIIHRKTTSELKEIYPTNEVLHEYLEKGRNKFKFELILMAILLCISVGSLLGFLTNHVLIFIMIYLMFCIAIGILGSNFSVLRFQLYKNGFD